MVSSNVYGRCRNDVIYNHAWGGTIPFPEQEWNECLYDDIAIDNPAISLFLNSGFVEVYRTREYIMLKKDL